MGYQYDSYLEQHKSNVASAFDWLKEHLPEVVKDVSDYETHYSHDHSKSSQEDYDAYDAYFYGNNRSYKVVNDFKKRGCITFITIRIIGSTGFLSMMTRRKELSH